MSVRVDYNPPLSLTFITVNIIVVALHIMRLKSHEKVVFMSNKCLNAGGMNCKTFMLSN